MRERIPLLVALVFGAIAVILIYNYMQANKKIPPVMRTILVAKSTIPAGQVLEERYFTKKSVTEDIWATMQGTFINYMDRLQIIGRVTRVQIAKDKPIITTALEYERDKVPDLTPQISRELRGITIPISNISAVSFLVKPGDHVDLLVNYEIPYIRETEVEVPNTGKFKVGQKETEPATIYLLQNVVILGVDRSIIGDEAYTDTANQGYRGVTIGVTPQEARMLAFANKNADEGYTLTLRNPDDDSLIEDFAVASYKTVLEKAKLEEMFNRSKQLRAVVIEGGEEQE